MDKYEMPAMEIIDFKTDVRTNNDIVLNSVIEKNDNNNPFEGPDGF